MMFCPSCSITFNRFDYSKHIDEEHDGVAPEGVRASSNSLVRTPRFHPLHVSPCLITREAAVEKASRQKEKRPQKKAVQQPDEEDLERDTISLKRKK